MAHTTPKPVILPDWKTLLHKPEKELAALDIAVVNLACAVGLPGTDRYDIACCLKCLDDWAIGVGQITEEAIAKDFRKNPSEYENSEPLFRMVILVRALQRYCGVRYNPARVNTKLDPFWQCVLDEEQYTRTKLQALLDTATADEQFIHGAILGPGGTCANLAVVYVAVGRRIGYPVRVVYTNGHIFCRWDDPATGVKINIEGAHIEGGVSCRTDDHYRRWPGPFDARAEAFFGFLRSLSPKGELASFLYHRSLVLRNVGAYLQAIDAAVGAVIAEPACEGYLHLVHRLIREWVKRLDARGLIGHDFRYPIQPIGPRRWPNIPWPDEAQILSLDAAEQGTFPVWGFPWDSSKPKKPIADVRL